MIRLSIEQIRAVRTLCHINTDLRTRFHDDETESKVSEVILNNYEYLFGSYLYDANQAKYAEEQVMRGS